MMLMKTRVRIVITLWIAIFMFSRPISAFEIPDKWEKSTVAIGMRIFELKDQSTGQVEEKRALSGTGVLIKTDRFILVTAKHVVFDNQGNQFPNLCFWGNKLDGTEFERSFSEFSKKWPNLKWVAHPDPDIDIAAAIVGLDLEKDSIAFVTLEDFEDVINIKKGTDVYYLGFPLNFGASYGSNPMLRKGIVALKEKKDNFFYIDATVAPGNSGGPVFMLQNDIPKFLGLVSRFEPFFRAGQYFHAGISVVYPVDWIRNLLESKEFKATY